MTRYLSRLVSRASQVAIAIPAVPPARSIHDPFEAVHESQAQPAETPLAAPTAAPIPDKRLPSTRAAHATEPQARRGAIRVRSGEISSPGRRSEK